MITLRDKVKAHVREQCLDYGQVTEPMHKLADRIGVSVATVHRAIKEMERDYVIKVIPSLLRTQPNTILYIGDPTYEEPKISKIHTEFRGALVSELVYHLKHKQRIIKNLQYKLQNYQDLEVVERVNLPHGIEVIFRQRGNHSAESRGMDKVGAKLRTEGKGDNDPRMADRSTS